MWYLTERIETPFSAFNFFLGGGRESSVSVLLCFLTLVDEAGLKGMLGSQLCRDDAQTSAKKRTFSKHVIHYYLFFTILRLNQ